jgi:inhibitor of KinA
MEMPVITSLGESALVIRWENRIDRSLSQQVNALADAIRKKPFEGLIDLVPAYCSLTVLYDTVQIRTVIAGCSSASEFVKNYIESLIGQKIEESKLPTKIVDIPVCYDILLDNDLSLISAFANLDIEQVIDRHVNEMYYVYMPGFLPGFVYMGDVDKKIAIPRKQQPVPVSPGAVGIAGNQTGIYPVNSPGGWHILGYTPLRMFDSQSPSPCLLQVGDFVKFYPINISNYQALKKQSQNEYNNS